MYSQLFSCRIHWRRRCAICSDRRLESHFFMHVLVIWEAYQGSLRSETPFHEVRRFTWPTSPGGKEKNARLTWKAGPNGGGGDDDAD